MRLTGQKQKGSTCAFLFSTRKLVNILTAKGEKNKEKKIEVQAPMKSEESGNI